MYTIHQAQALILDSMEVGEANKFYWLLTREHGLVNATAQGVRWTKSKLNAVLQDYHVASVEFVRGREVWRITNANSINSFDFFSLTKKSQEIVARICLLLKRLYVGEEANQTLFDDVIEGFERLSKSFDAQTVEAVETVMVLKILYHLGYWEEHKEHYPLHTSPYSKEVLEKALQKKQDLRKRITQSLRESHL
jgi:DNA repair protein RecO